MRTYKVSAIICCAGKGERAGFGKNKLLCPLGDAPALYHTLKKFERDDIDEVIVACAKDDFDEICTLVAPFGYKVVLGGETRTQTVFNALEKVTGDVVLVCDGARPYVSQKIISDCIDGVIKNGSAVCCTPVTDTTVVAVDGKIASVPQRNGLFAVQTPQGFLSEKLKYAYQKAVLSGETFTDDASVFLKYVGEPYLFLGERENVKLTYKSDFDLGAPTIVCNGADRVGFGVDIHAFGKPQGYVILCGEKIDCDCGLIAHSDGDVCVHALMDALLSACGLDDIGHYFPDTDEKWKNADSMKMLAHVVKMVAEKGFECTNAVICIQAEKPRIAKHVPTMKDNLARVLGLDENALSVCAGTSEKLGFVGEGKGIKATATVLLKKI